MPDGTEITGEWENGEKKPWIKTYFISIMISKTIPSFIINIKIF